jgi:hypothetical protein
MHPRNRGSAIRLRCCVSSITIPRSVAEKPAFAKGVTFPKDPTFGGDLNILGPYNNPKNGEVAFVYWVVIEGTDMADCRFDARFVGTTKQTVNGRLLTANQPRGSLGFNGYPDPIARWKAGERDGPQSDFVLPKDPDKFLIMADAPGWPATREQPMEKHNNFIVLVVSKRDGQVADTTEPLGRFGVMFDYENIVPEFGKPTKNELTPLANPVSPELWNKIVWR